MNDANGLDRHAHRATTRRSASSLRATRSVPLDGDIDIRPIRRNDPVNDAILRARIPDAPNWSMPTASADSVVCRHLFDGIRTSETPLHHACGRSSTLYVDSSSVVADAEIGASIRDPVACPRAWSPSAECPTRRMESWPAATIRERVVNDYLQLPDDAAAHLIRGTVTDRSRVHDLYDEGELADADDSARKSSSSRARVPIDRGTRRRR